ncbi:carbon starvation protein A [Dehalococcoidia bacterium]|nr:carbon starvation protein A [Dehalococcoidia bacterium]
MNAILFILLVIALYILSYRFYAKFLAEKIWKLDPRRTTPAHKFNDGFEYVPTRKHVVWGHHFSSIAGAAPIIGPIIAAIWGWLPALLWIVFGTIFMGAVHDFGTLVNSLRHEGRGIADFLKELIGPRATQLLYVVVFFVLVLVSAVFVHVIAVLLSKFPAAVISVWIEIPLAMIIGSLIVYRRLTGRPLLSASLIAVAIMYAMIVVGVHFPVELTYKHWVFICFVYMLIAARLPVWLLVQARDFINSHQLFIALGVLTLGVFALGGAAEMAAPAVRVVPPDAPPIWPFLMIIIACGAMSGWHSMVASGTTPKQIDKEPDARAVGYGGMLGEGYLAVIALLTAVVGLGAAGYAEAYSAWGVVKWPAVWATGGSTFLGALGIPAAYAAAFMAVVLVSFAMTTLDSAMRFTRIAFAESAKTFKLPGIFQDRTVSLIPGFLVIVFLAWPRVPKPYGMELWPLFGATNQIMAGLGLLAAGVFLWTLGRRSVYYIVPFIIAIVTSMTAMAYSIAKVWIPQGEWVLAGIGSIVFLCAIGVMVLAYQTWRARRQESGVKNTSPS